MKINDCSYKGNRILFSAINNCCNTVTKCTRKCHFQMWKGAFPNPTASYTSNFEMTPWLLVHHRQRNFWLCLCTKCK